MASLTAVATPLLALGALGVAVAAHVGASESVDRGPAVAQLEKRVGDLETERDDLRIKLGKADRQIRGLSSDLASLRNELLQRGGVAASLEAGPDAAPAGGPESEAATDADAAMPVSLGEEEVARLAKLLESDTAQEALRRAARKERERADTERWSRMVDGLVDRFAEKANLTEQQTTQMKDIAGRSMREIRDVWMSMREAGNLDAEQRGALIADNRAKMEDIRAKSDEEVKAVLSGDQYEMYLEDMDRMRGFGGRGRGGRGRDNN
jgi:hypothetical protein